MLRLALSLRYLMLVGALGALVGALLMFAEAVTKLAGGFRALISPDGSGGKPVIAAVMGATDASLFGMVLMFFAYAVTFGFVFEFDEATRARLPRWMRVDGVTELKHSLVAVIIVYLIVDFATDIAEGGTHVTWETLVMPAAILLIAGALRLMTPSEHGLGGRAEGRD